jgi:hypothetical protein
MTFKVSGPSAEHLRGLWPELGAVLTGRRTFDVAQGWGGNHAWGPAFVLTHHIPAGWPRPNSTVHFVTDGIESAVNQAKAAAAGKSVGVHGVLKHSGQRGGQGVAQGMDRGALNSDFVEVLCHAVWNRSLFSAQHYASKTARIFRKNVRRVKGFCKKFTSGSTRPRGAITSSV